MQKIFLHSRPSRKNRESGFALIIALSLMAFILLLLVSMTSLIRVETQSANVQGDVTKARLNAMLGAAIAVGELQKHAGPDQRATATADVLRADPNRTSDHAWTGVWLNDTNDDGEVTALDDFRRPKPVLLRWLVSGDANPDSSRNNEALVDAMDWVWMVNQSVETNDDDDLVNKIQVPKVRIPSDADPEGAYAWWVSDEGVKAKVNMVDPHLDSDPDLSVRVSQRPKFSSVEGLGESFETSESVAGVPNRSKVFELKTLPFADADATAPVDLFHDVTAYSFGVLADTRNGGLRKDLTRAFAPNDEDALKLIRDDLEAVGRPAATSSYIFEPAGGTETADDPGGPRWEQLRDYYNLRPTTTNVIDLTTTGSDLPVINHRDDQLGVYPVVTWAQLRYYVTMTDEVDPVDATAPVTRRVVFWILPTVQLWNPYDVDLVVPDLYVLISTEIAEQNNLAYKWRVFDQDGRVAPQSRNFIQFEEVDDANDNPLPLILKLEGTTTIPAGASRLFSPKGNQQIATNEEMFGGADKNVLSSDPTVNGVDYGLYYINNNPAYDRSEFTYDPTAGSYFANIPSATTEVDLNLRLATGTDFDDLDLIQVIDDVNNTTSILAGTNIDPLPAQNLVEPLNLDINPDHPFDRYPIAANSFMQLWTNTWMTSDPSNSGVMRMPWLSLLNPRSSFVGRSGFETDTAVDTVPNKEKYAKPPGLNSHASQHGHIKPNTPYVGWDVNKIKDSNDIGFIGWDYNDDSGANIQKTTLFEVPRNNTSILSVGQFMHANLTRNGNFDSNPDATNQAWFQPGNRHLYNNYSPAYPIGNSLASPWVPLNQTSLDWSTVTGAGAIDGVHYDYSYLLNEALWDRYFITAIPSSDNIPDPLPNSRLIRNPFDSSLADADRSDFDRAAVAYMTQGAFNVNSTSVEAWKALLSSFFGFDVATSSGVDDESSSPFARFNTPQAFSFIGSNPALSEAYNGYRRLTSAEIDELANAIVNEMKKDPDAAFDAPEGGRIDPYLNLADFVNRDLVGHPNVQRKGLLQRAIDATTINSVIADNSGTTVQNADGVMEAADGDIPETSASVGYTEEAFEGIPYAANTPGYLSQADLLARLGPVLATRSDTFKVRSFGNYTEPISSETGVQAWVELTVQRIPAYVDDSVPAETTAQSLIPGSSNEIFGRQFRVLNFRWLSESEI